MPYSPSIVRGQPPSTKALTVFKSSDKQAKWIADYYW